MARLRDRNGGCPWDLEQNFATIAPYTIEEAYEVADAIERADMPGLCDELGDLQLQVVYHARMAEEAGHFDLGDVLDGISAKMIRRHPHVFGDEETRATAEAQKDFWEKLKEGERAAAGHASLLDDVASALPALTRANDQYIERPRAIRRVAHRHPAGFGILDQVEVAFDPGLERCKTGWREIGVG